VASVTIIIYNPNVYNTGHSQVNCR